MFRIKKKVLYIYCITTDIIHFWQVKLILGRYTYYSYRDILGNMSISYTTHKNISV